MGERGACLQGLSKGKRYIKNNLPGLQSLSFYSYFRGYPCLVGASFRHGSNSHLSKCKHVNSVF